MKTAVLLVNVGTPDSPDVRDVRKFLKEFLNDSHVMTMPWLFRKILVNGIIIPFRVRGSAAAYRQLWTETGSPIRFYLERVRALLQESMHIDVWAAMNYGYPVLHEVLMLMSEQQYSRLIVVPLFPQYAVSTSGSIEYHVRQALKEIAYFPEITFISQFFNDPFFIEAWRSRISTYKPELFDHVIFSFHGLPLSHLPETCRKGCTCGNSCYRAECQITADNIAQALHLPKEGYSIAYQSRMSNRWMRPFINDVLKGLADSGRRNVLIVAPSFVADCLETTVELGIQYRKLFLECGGTHYEWVKSLNEHPKWIETLENIVNRACR